MSAPASPFPPPPSHRTASTSSFAPSLTLTDAESNHSTERGFSPTLGDLNLSTAAFPSAHHAALFPTSGSSTLSPPDYHSIVTPSEQALKEASAHAGRNREKQAIRDQQRARADAVHQNQRHRVTTPSRPAPSVEPSSRSGSQSDPSSGEIAQPVGLGINGISQLQRPATYVDRGSFSQQRPFLPPGMDLHEALSKCEDPRLGWSLQFWVTIADPSDGHVFFACPATGHCSWDPPVGAFVVPRSPDGEWWELADTSRKNRSYYFNTLTHKTQWTRPAGDAFVIPLGLIQRTALPPRTLSESSRGSASQFSPGTHGPLGPVLATSPVQRSHRHSTSNIPQNSRASTSNAPQLSPQHRSSHLPTHIPAQRAPTETRNIRFPNSAPQPAVRSPSTPPRTPSANSQIFSPPSPSPRNSFIDPPPGAPLFLLDRRVPSDPVSIASQTTSSPSVPRTPLSMVGEESGNETDVSDNPTGSWWEKRRSKGFVPSQLKVLSSPRKGKEKATDDQERVPLGSAPVIRLLHSQNGDSGHDNVIGSIGDSDVPPPPRADGSVLPKHEPSEPILVHPSMRMKRMSTGLHPVLPSNMTSEIQAFQEDDFDKKYFATKRTGVLRQRIPVEQLMEWQRQPISSPLLLPSKNVAKEATTTFKVIQHVMGERDRPIEAAKPVQTSSSALNIASMALGGRKGDEGHATRSGRLANGIGNGTDGSGTNPVDVHGKSEKTVVLEEIRWLIQSAVQTVEIRDEVYSQLIKQLTKNPDRDAVVLGFQLCCVLVNAFGPSREFEPFIKSFLGRHIDVKEDGIGVMTKYCITKLDIMASKGGRGKVLTVGEIEHASDAAFYPSVYGESLSRIMTLQARSYPSLKVPVILPFLADGILAFGGMHSEGIFRVPGDADSVSELRSRMDRGHYQLNGINDPHVAASLFKLWLRELEEPIVPTALYNDALSASRSTSESVNFVFRLPVFNRRVLLFVISFFQLFTSVKVIETTKMTPQNLALVLAPNILRTTSDSLVTVFTNASFESKFVLQLLEHLDPSDVDVEYKPTHGLSIGREDAQS